MTHAPSTLRTLRPGLHALETRVEEFDVRAVVVEGRDRVLVWDTLAHPDQMGPVASLLGGRAVVVAYSHADWDHVYGTAGVPGVGEVVAHETCAARFVREVPGELAARRRGEPGRWDDVELVPPTTTFDDTVELELGGLVVHLAHLPGHTGDSAVAWIPDWGVLLAGDAVETPLPVVNDGGAVAEWVELLRGWETHPELALVVPAHGSVGGIELLAGSADYLQRLLDGTAPPPPATAAAFYLRTHEENLRAVGS
jgi:glyoxylase-like metal-dependent hydrolase (beta-lactamase superfamily II)